MVKQVLVVSILMIVQGILQLLMGLYLAVVGPFIMFAMGEQMFRPTGGGPDPAVMSTMMIVLYLLLGVFLLVSGGLLVYGGIKSLKFKGRTVSLVALFSTLASVFSCYCFPTGLALMIYGLIVLFNDQVAQAYEMGEQGRDPREIRDHFERGGGDWQTFA